MFERRHKILVIDDDESWLQQTQLLFDSTIYELECYVTIDQGLEALSGRHFDLVLLDLNFEGESQDGLDAFRCIHALDKGTDVIVISGETNPLRIVEMMNAGVAKFIPKLHSSADAILDQVNKVLENQQFRSDSYNQLLKSHVGESILGHSPLIKKMRMDIQRIANTGVKDILILGETGTGKELVARAVAHIANPSLKTVTLHCGAIADGLAESEFFGHVKGAFTGALTHRVGAFESADGGFVFLDEIGEMPLPQQTRLLRVLQERKVVPLGTNTERSVNFRCIAATHVNLKLAMAKGTFREDLYYRLAKDIIHVPPLRDRPEDIPQLVHSFVNKAGYSGKKSFSTESIHLLQNHSWPGNIRQLKASVESILSRSQHDVIRDKDIVTALPELAIKRSTSPKGATTGGQMMNEKQMFQKAVIRAKGNRTEAAKLLGISRATFFRRAKELGLVGTLN